MGVNIHNLIAAIIPDVYCDSEKKAEVKKLLKEKLDYLQAAGVAKVIKPSPFNYEAGRETDPFSKPGLKAPLEQHTLVYDSAADGLEPIYFWILDTMQPLYSGGINKIVDNFVSSTGSGHFSELSGKSTRMQEEAMKMLVAVNQVVKSVLNLIYDLKEFETRLALYDQLNSKDYETKMNALLSLKQLWLDTVDIKRGGTAIKQLAFGGQALFVTLIDAFMAAENDKLEYNGKKMDLNERVERILKQRLNEFFIWLRESDKELRKRYEIEKIYLKSQYNSLQLYARWMKPYLEAAKQLEQRASGGAALVNAFNTVIFELVLLGEDKYDPKDDVAAGILPKSFEKSTNRKYTPIIIIEFNFRSIPQKVGQHYAFGGRAEVKFTSYALNNDELEVLKAKIEEDTFGDLVSIISGMTKDSIELIKDDLIKFGAMEGKEEKKEEKKEDINPFSALFSLFSFGKKKSAKKEKGWWAKEPISSDSDYEKIIRSQAILQSREKCFTLFDLYKKAHGMPSHYDPYVRI